MDTPPPQPSIKTLGSTLEVPSNYGQQENLQELLSSFDILRKSQHIYYYSPKVATTQ